MNRNGVIFHNRTENLRVIGIGEQYGTLTNFQGGKSQVRYILHCKRIVKL